MDNLELIDAYLRDEMNTSQKVSFEEQMASDPKLQGEFEFQNQVVSGIKEARKVQLKAMLDNVAVGGSLVESLSAGKIVAGLLVSAVIGWGIYYFNESSQESGEFLAVAKESETAADFIIEENSIDPVQENVEEPLITESEPVENNTTQSTIDKNKAVAQELKSSEPQFNKPELIADFDGDNETSDSLLAPGSTTISGEVKEMSSIDVKIDNTKKKFSFHYQFKNERLFLYGDFSSDLYEILEFNSNSERTLFLFYKDKFYDLSNDQEKITELKTVKNKTLLAKLKKARSGN